jgi:hypothetical protein
VPRSAIRAAVVTAATCIRHGPEYRPMIDWRRRFLAAGAFTPDPAL